MAALQACSANDDDSTRKIAPGFENSKNLSSYLFLSRDKNEFPESGFVILYCQCLYPGDTGIPVMLFITGIVFKAQWTLTDSRFGWFATRNQNYSPLTRQRRRSRISGRRSYRRRSPYHLCSLLPVQCPIFDFLT